jgi:hypothetical protein
MFRTPCGVNNNKMENKKYDGQISQKKIMSEWRK